MVSAGDWRALYERLRDVDRAELLADPSLAYRFGECLYYTGRMLELSSYGAELEIASREASDTYGIMRALNLAGTAAFELGQIDEASEKYHRLQDMAEVEENEDMLSRAANNLGMIANLRGHPEEAIACYRMAIPVYQRLRQMRGLAQTCHNLGLSYRDLGRLDDAVKAFQEAADLAESINHQPLLCMSIVGRAEVQLMASDKELSCELVQRGLQLARDAGDPISEAEALRVRGLAKSDSVESECAEALSDFDAAARLARQTGNVLLEAEIDRDVGRAYWKLGRAAAARAKLERAADLFENLGALAAATACRAELASA